MSEVTKIAWTRSTFNPWIGCTKVGPGCDHCYAEQSDKMRFSKTLGGGTKERPILFSGPMVRAILDGTKTQTRRVVRGQVLGDPRPMMLMRGRAWDGSQFQNAEISKGYGDIGDRLWVRETWAIQDCGARVSLDKKAWSEGWPIKRLWYRADHDAEKYNWNTRPSIFMPRWASRITLEVTNVRVERLQEITEDDAYAEGCFALGDCECTARRQYQILWDKLNSKRGFGWDTNPWVWAIEFRRVT